MDAGAAHSPGTRRCPEGATCAGTGDASLGDRGAHRAAAPLQTQRETEVGAEAAETQVLVNLRDWWTECLQILTGQHRHVHCHWCHQASWPLWVWGVVTTEG